MKKVFLITLCALFFVISFTSCREKTKTTTVVKEVEVEKTETGDKEGVLERIGNEVDKEVNKEIDKEIKKIGNDDSN